MGDLDLVRDVLDKLLIDPPRDGAQAELMDAAGQFPLGFLRFMHRQVDRPDKTLGMLSLHCGNAVVQHPRDVRPHHLHLVGEDRNRDAGLVHDLQMRLEILARRIKRQTDFIGYNTPPARLGRQAVEQRHRHIVMMDVNDKVCGSHSALFAPYGNGILSGYNVRQREQVAQAATSQ